MKKMMISVLAGFLLVIPVASRAEYKSSYAVLVPGAANTPGLHGSMFKTRITIFNGSPYDFSVMVQLFNQNGGVTTGSIWLPHRSFGLAYYTLEDFLGSLGYHGGGAFTVTSMANTVNDDVRQFVFAISVEVYNDIGQGQFTTAVPIVDLANQQTTSNSKTQFRLASEDPGATSAFTAYNYGINTNENHRVNIACANISRLPTNVKASVYDVGGRLLQEITFNMPPIGWKQEPITTPVPISDGYIVWTANNKVTPYAVGVDNKSNDGTIQLAVSE